MEKERSMSRYRSIGKLLAGCTAKGNVTGSPAWVWREGGTVCLLVECRTMRDECEQAA